MGVVAQKISITLNAKVAHTTQSMALINRFKENPDAAPQDVDFDGRIEEEAGGKKKKKRRRKKKDGDDSD